MRGRHALRAQPEQPSVFGGQVRLPLVVGPQAHRYSSNLDEPGLRLKRLGVLVVARICDENHADFSRTCVMRLNWR